MTGYLVEILYYLAAGLLLPVLLVLLGFLVSGLLTLGGLAREAIQRRADRPAWRRFLAAVQSGDVAAVEFYRLTADGRSATRHAVRGSGYIGRFRRETAAYRDSPLAVKKCLDDLEIDIARRLARLSLATRVGPMLGLVGTLIPLGPALTGLASGNLGALAGNLIIAFTTTVFGILVGGFAYAVCLVRRAWYEQDVSDLEFLADMLHSRENQPAALEAEDPRLV